MKGKSRALKKRLQKFVTKTQKRIRKGVEMIICLAEQSRENKDVEGYNSVSRYKKNNFSAFHQYVLKG